MQDTIYIAKIGKTVGLKGQLKLNIDSDFPEQFSKNAQFTTNKNITLTIESFNTTSKVVKFKGIDSIEDAQKIINQQLFSTLEDTKNNCTLKDNQYFWFDLVDCNIVEDGIILGKVAEVHRYPQSDYFEIKTSKNLVEEEDKAKVFLLPYIEQYIKQVDITNKTIIVQGAMEILEAS